MMIVLVVTCLNKNMFCCFLQMAFSSLTSGQLKRWADEINSTPALAAIETGFPLVVEFLNTSGQTVLAHQGQLLDQQVVFV